VEVSAFLSHLAEVRRVSASTQNQALSALLFLYRHVLRQELGRLAPVVRAKRSEHLPVVLTRDEVRAVLHRLDGVMWLAVSMLYGAGLRLSECLGLRVKDLDFATGQIVVRSGKGGKDRVTHSAASSCRRPSSGSIRPRRSHGAGSSCFPRRGCAAIHDGVHPTATICTNRSCSGRWRSA
jgi:integrase